MSLAAFNFSRTIFHTLAASWENTRARGRSEIARRVESLSDAELVAQHRTGDPHAFAELVKRYTNAVYNVTYRFTNNAADAEHLTQETFLRAWNVLPRLDAQRPLKPYLMKIAVNLCRDWAAQTRVEMIGLGEQEEMLVAENAPDLLENLSDQELRERVRAKIELLPPLYRAVVTLRYSEELSYEEIAAALDMPLNTVRTHLHRAKARLRELLEQDA